MDIYSCPSAILMRTANLATLTPSKSSKQKMETTCGIDVVGLKELLGDRWPGVEERKDAGKGPNRWSFSLSLLYLVSPITFTGTLSLLEMMVTGSIPDNNFSCNNRRDKHNCRVAVTTHSKVFDDPNSRSRLCI